MRKYDHKEIEKKWQEKWKDDELYKTPDSVPGKENFYMLVEFPYPSGNLHVGHWYAFSVPDIFVRAQRMQGVNIMYPIGFDAFGLPAENAAIKRNLNPRDWTLENMETMKKQFQSMGASFDWSREVVTCNPDYYKWTQWLFLQFYKNNLAYQAETKVNWCPSCKTVLANEQVVQGLCERCESEVEQREMKQWMLKIKDYGDRLIDDLEDLDWPEEIKNSQRNWIGRSEGAKIIFKANGKDLEVFTTRPDTLFGVTYIVLSPEHGLLNELDITNRDELETYQKQALKKDEIERTAVGKDKTGVKLEDVTAINPANGEEIPVYVADYVMAGYGTGAIMAVPAHDERDHVFAEKYDLPIKTVVMPRCVDHTNPHREGKEVVFRNGVIAIIKNPKTGKYLALRWKEQPWTTFVIGGIEGDEDPIEAAKREIIEETGFKNLKVIKTLCGPIQSEFFAAHKDINRVLHSWSILLELQDEETEPISKEEQAKHEVIWVDESDITEDGFKHSEMPYILRALRNEEEIFTGKGILINSGEFDGLDSVEAKQKITEKVGGEMTTTFKLRDWVVSRQRYWGCPIPVIHCKDCGVVPISEKELPVKLPDVDDYLPREDGKSPLAKAEGWMNVSCPSCGKDAKRETDTLDTFVDSSWYYLRYTDPQNENAFASLEKMEQWMPVTKYSGGAEHTTMHLLYSRFFCKAMNDMGLVPWKEPFVNRMNRGLILGPDKRKMSKSKGNVIDPDAEVERMGADTVRMYLAFIGPYNEVGSYPWDPNGIVGLRRFLEKIWRQREKVSADVKDRNVIESKLHKTIKKVTEDIQTFDFNTAIAMMMELANAIEKEESLSKETYTIVLRLLAPFAPHITEELWQEYGEAGSIHLAPWPEYNEAKIVSDTVTIVVQVNGKIRGEFIVEPNMSEEDLKEKAQTLPSVKQWIDGKEITKIIVVTGKLVSIVIK